MLILKLALRPWRLSPFSQLFSAIAVGFLLLLAGFLFWIQEGLRPVLSRLHNEQVITAYLDAAVDSKEEAKIVDTVRLALGAQADSEALQKIDVALVDAKQFLGHLRGSYPDLTRELEDLGPEMSGIVPRYVSVSGLLSEDALNAVKAVPGIESAESSKDRYQQVLGAFSALRWVARVLAAGLCLALLTGLIHLSRMNAYLHKEAFALLRLWGAGTGMLYSPGILSGLLVGWAGGVIAGVGWITGGAWLAQHVRTLSPLLRTMPGAPAQLGIFLLLAGGMIGLLSGVLGSLSISAERS